MRIIHYDNTMHIEIIESLQRLVDDMAHKYNVPKEDVFKEIKSAYMCDEEVQKL